MYKVIIFVVVAAMGLCLYVFINEARPLIRSTPGPTRRMPVRGQLNRILKEETATKEEEGTTRRVVLVVYVAHPIALSSLAAVRRAYAPAHFHSVRFVADSRYCNNAAGLKWCTGKPSRTQELWKKELRGVPHTWHDGEEGDLELLGSPLKGYPIRVHMAPCGGGWLMYNGWIWSMRQMLEEEEAAAPSRAPPTGFMLLPDDAVLRPKFLAKLNQSSFWLPEGAPYPEHPKFKLPCVQRSPDGLWDSTCGPKYRRCKEFTPGRASSVKIVESGGTAAKGGQHARMMEDFLTAVNASAKWRPGGPNNHLLEHRGPLGLTAPPGSGENDAPAPFLVHTANADLMYVPWGAARDWTELMQMAYDVKLNFNFAMPTAARIARPPGAAFAKLASFYSNAAIDVLGANAWMKSTGMAWHPVKGRGRWWSLLENWGGVSRVDREQTNKQIRNPTSHGNFVLTS